MTYSLKQELNSSILILPNFKQATEPDLLAESSLDQIKKLTIGLLPDGNERAKKNGKDYGDGSKNVIKTVLSLVERPDVEKVIFFLLSKENILKREPEFFSQIYKAFLQLGIAVELEKLFIRQGIKLEITGEMELLNQRGSEGQKLFEMIQAVVAKTQTDQPPKLTLKFGIGYSTQTVNEEGIDLLIRSGMESQNAFRSSGLELSEKTIAYSFTELWPELSIPRIHQAIDQSKTQSKGKFNQSHDHSILEILEKIDLPFDKLNIKIAVPIAETRAKLTEVLSSTKTHLKSKPVHILENGQKDLKNGINLIPIDPNQPSPLEAEFTNIIAPGQTAPVFRMPNGYRVNYATIHGSAPDPASISNATNEAIGFLLLNPQLKGASRKAETSADLESVAEEMTEFDYYDNLDLTSSIDHLSPEEHFKITADRFVVKMLNWAEQKGFHFNKAVEKRAFINYAYTSFFLVYYPQHQNWEQLKSGWEKRAEILTKYMEAVYLLDDKIFDLELPLEVKKTEVNQATKVLISAIKGESYQIDQNLIVANELKVVAEIIEELRSEFEVGADSELLELWVENFCELIRANSNEFAYFTDNLASLFLREYDQNPKILQLQNLKKELGSIMKSIFSSGDNFVEIESFLNYLLQIENSIGAGMTYFTLAMTYSNNKLDLNKTNSLSQLCSISNIYYRLANDMSEVFRDIDDQEQCIDSREFVSKIIKTNGKDVNPIEVGAAIIKLMQGLKRSINSHQSVLSDGNNLEKSISISVDKSEIGELFYKGTHYHVAKRSDVYNFFRQLNCKK